MRFVVIEGPDGVGKTTLVQRYADIGRPTYKFPADPRPAKGLQRAKAMLDDMASFQDELTSASGAVVDRYDMSTLVYQGLLYGRAAELGYLDIDHAVHVMNLMKSSWSDYAHPDGYVILLGPRLRRPEDAISNEDRIPYDMQRLAYEYAARCMRETFGMRVLGLYDKPPVDVLPTVVMGGLPPNGSAREHALCFSKAAGSDHASIKSDSYGLAVNIDDEGAREQLSIISERDSQ